MHQDRPAARYDCVIVGGGPAGLSAALVLGRCRRRVVVCDAGRPRNARAAEMHGYLSRDGTPPSEFLRMGREELARYPTVELRAVEVVDAVCLADGFEVRCADGQRLLARKLLLATGVVDELPKVEGLAPLYGTSVHHCPYCDGWEWRDQPLAAYGQGEDAVGLALGLTVWSDDVVLCSDGPVDLSPQMHQRLVDSKIRIRTERVRRLEGRDGWLERVVFEEGDPLPRRALFFATGQHQHSPLARRLGCEFNEKGTVDTGTRESTNVPGLFVAGDASKDVQFVIVAAAEGALAAVEINRSLLKDELARSGAEARPRPARSGRAAG